MSYSSTALHVTTTQGFLISDDIKGELNPENNMA